MTEGRPLMDILAEMDDREAIPLEDLILIREAQASINLDGNTQSLPPVPEDMYPADAVDLEPFEGYPRDEPMKDINVVGTAEMWKPPSETVLNTVGHQSFYLVESLEEVMDRANQMKDADFAMIFEVAPQGGSGARRVLVPWQAVDCIIDLSEEPVD